MLLRNAILSVVACAAGCTLLLDAPSPAYVDAAAPDASDVIDASDRDGRPDDASFGDGSREEDSAGMSEPDEGGCMGHAQCEAPDECISGLCNPSTASCEYRVLENCTGCGTPGSICVQGTCRPDGVFYASRFEAGALGHEWTSSALRPWSLTDSPDERRMRVASSAEPGEDASSNLELRLHDVPDHSRLVFWLRVSSEFGFDYLELHIRGASISLEMSRPIEMWSAEEAWQRFETEVGAVGEVIFTFRYVTSRDASFDGENRAFIDDVSVYRNCD